MNIFVVVKKVIVIFLLLQIVSNNTFAEELIKIPGLITHYFHHSKEHGDPGSFFDFLHKHYCDNHSKDKHADGNHDEDKDCNLPFKHCGGCCLNLHSSILAFVPTCLTADYTFYQVKNNIFPIADDRIESLDVCTIWLPPKIS